MPQLPAQRIPKPLGAGMTLAVVVGLFAWGGNWLDLKLGCRPLFLLLGVALGAVGGFLHLLAAVAPEMLPFGRKKPPTQSQDEPRDDSRNQDSNRTV